MFQRIAEVGLAAVLVAALCHSAVFAQKITVAKTKPVGELIKQLKSQNEFERDEAMYALVEKGKASVPALVKLLGDATALQATPPPGFGHHYGQGTRHDVRWGDRGGMQYYPSGLTVNRLAMRALGLIGDKRAVNALAAAEKQAANGWVRDEARRALIATLGAKMPILPNMRPWQLAEIANPKTAKQIVDAIAGRLKPDGYWGAKGSDVKKLGPHLVTGHPDDIRRIDALGAIGNKGASLLLLRILKEGVHHNWMWFHCGLHNTMDLWHAQGVSVTAGMDDSWACVLASARASSNIGDKRAIPLLRARLADKNIMVRVNAALALARLGDKAALKGLIPDLRWMHTEFVSDYNTKGKPWLQHWPNDNQSAAPRSGKTWYRENPSYHAIVGYDALGYIKSKAAAAFLKKRTADILKLGNVDQYYQVDLLWLASSLKKHGEKTAAEAALAAGMKLFEGNRAYDWKLRHFHLAALPALAKINDKRTLPAVVRTMIHHPSTWRPGQYDLRDVAWGVYLILKGRRDAEKPLYTSEVLWYH